MKWYIGVGILLVLAMVLQLGLLAFAMYVLLLVLLVTRLLARFSIDGLQVRRKCNVLSAEVGETVNVQLTIRNEGRLPIPWVLLEDLLPRQALVQRPPRLRVKGKRMKLSMIGSGGKTTLKYELELLMRGYYQIGPLVMETGDLFGLHRRYRVGADPHFILVLPRVVPLTGYDIASRRPIGEIRLSHRLYEDPTRIGGVRLYLAGDPLNRVHWRATARTMTLHSKIYEPSTIAGGTIVLDFHQASYHQRGEPYRSELAVTVAASLANALYQMNQQVGFISNGRDAADRIREEGWDGDFRTRQAARQTAAMSETSDRLEPLVVPTRRGPEQLMRILETLARVELTDGLSFAELIVEASPRMPRDATVIALLGSVTPETAQALGNLRRQGMAVTAILLIFEEKPFEQAYGRLVAEGVEVRHLKDESQLADMCSQHLLR